MSPLESPQLSIKYLLADPMNVELEELIPVFHRLIQENALEPELMIDVANYAHMHHGPGIMIICNTAHYAVDTRNGRPGVYFSRRREADGSVADRVAEAFRSALRFAALLEAAPEIEGRYAINTGAFEFAVFDRLRAPNSAPTDDVARPVVSSFIERLYQSQGISIASTMAPRQPYVLRVTVDEAPKTSELLTRLEALN